MSNLQTQIRDDMKTAMKAHDTPRTGTLRRFLAALTAEETSGARHKLDDDEVLKVLAREIKKRKESAQVYADAGRQELADQELAEVAVLEEYQPTQLTDDEGNTTLLRAGETLLYPATTQYVDVVPRGTTFSCIEAYVDAQ